jgi:hypothetical protein
MAQNPGGVSNETRTVVPRKVVREVDDLYPDRVATPTSAGVFPIRDTNATAGRLEEVPKVSFDMNKLFTWEHGNEEIRGTHAKKHKGMEKYIKDIDQAWGKESQYKHIYLDTFRPLTPQLEKIKSIGRRGSRR